MKFCTLVRIADGEDAEIIGVDAVEDEHRFGPTADGTLRHAEGWLDDGKIRAGGMCRGRMADLYAEPVPCGHPGTADAV